MKTTLYSITVCFLTLLFSCSDSTSTEKSNVEDSSCVYHYVNDSTKVKWTAFKFTAKSPVGGTFDDFTVRGLESGKAVKDIIQKASLDIDISGVNSNNPERDQNIINMFFKVMTNTDHIIGSVKSIEDDGSGIFSVTMNDVTVETPFSSALENQKLTLTTTINLDDFETHTAIDSLNVVCGDQHTGEDGKSVFWKDVDIEISTFLEKSCD